MKKLILFLTLFLLSTPTFAKCSFMDKCPQTGIPKSDFGSSLANMTGTTYLAQQFANNLIKNELKKALNQDFDVDIQAFDLNSLMQGKFKSLIITGKNLNLNGVSLSSIRIQTLCNSNSVNLQSNPISINENMVLGFWAELTDVDLQNTLSNPQYAEMIYKTDASKIGLKDCRIYPQTISIENGKLSFTANASPINPPIRPFDIAVTTDFRIQNEEIVQSNLALTSLFMNFDLAQLIEKADIQNALKYKIKILDNDADIQIENIYMNGNRVFANGEVLIKKK